jgi:putative transposase
MSRSNLYYQAVPETEENLLIMRFLDEQYFKTPFYGLRKLTKLLQQEGFCINKKRVRRLMYKINWQTIYRAPNTSIANKEHKIYPYLLRTMQIDQVNQVWSMDITYIPMRKGFMYLCAIIDVHTRYVVKWSLSNTMTTDWCLNTIQESISLHGKPQVVNTDQGSQFTSNVFTGFLEKSEIKISMDGKGRAIDNIWIERLWRSVKYEDVYLKSYSTVTELEAGLKKYFTFYNQERIHETLDYKTPDFFYKQAA